MALETLYVNNTDLITEIKQFWTISNLLAKNFPKNELFVKSIPNTCRIIVKNLTDVMKLSDLTTSNPSFNNASDSKAKV